MTREPCLGLPARFDLDRAEAQSEVSGKTGVSDFPNRMVWFWQIQLSSTVRTDDKDMTNLYPSGIWMREGKDRG
jgi:hypothetical protein